MRNRGGIQGVASSPILVGAVTILIVIVAVFLAYNANNGLPFVSTYDLKARVPNADALVKGNEVRIGGVRVGTVRSVVPVQLEDGEVAAELELRLDKSAEPLPVDSTITVRPKSALGLKFLQITPGDSDTGFDAGETIPVSSSKPEPVDIDEFFNMFDEKTRQGIRQNIAVALGLKAVFLVTTVIGVTGLWPAILADTGATVLVTMNALRLLGARFTS